MQPIKLLLEFLRRAQQSASSIQIASSIPKKKQIIILAFDCLF